VFCKHTFVVPANAAQGGKPPGALRGASPQPKPSGRGGAGVSIAIGVAFVAAGAAGFWNASRPTVPAEQPKPDPISIPVAPPTPIAPLAPVEVAVAVAPTAELGQIVEGTTSIGGKFYLVEYLNSGTVPIT
jgi:hypothetical protein